MYLSKTVTPGMAELSVGSYGSHTQNGYDKAMSPAALKAYNVVVASLIESQQKEETKFLIKNGFIQVGKARRNPNSGNMITLLVKFIRTMDK